MNGLVWHETWRSAAEHCPVRLARGFDWGCTQVRWNAVVTAPKHFLSATQLEQGFTSGIGQFPCALVHPAGARLCPRAFAKIFETASLQELQKHGNSSQLGM